MPRTLRTAVAREARHRFFRDSKAPSPLRSAGALQWLRTVLKPLRVGGVRCCSEGFRGGSKGQRKEFAIMRDV